MVTPEQLQHLQEILNPAANIIILVSNKPTTDEVAAAYGLAAAAQATGRSVLFAGPAELGHQPDYLLDKSIYTTNLGNRNLVISFEYSEEAVENVSYHIGEDSGKFFLTIKPQKGHKPLDAKNVEFSYAGAEADVVFLVGVSSYDALDELYVSNEQLFADAAVISLHMYETEVGQLKLNATGEPSLSNAMTHIIRHLNWSVPADAATSLLAGIEQATGNFKSLSTTPDTLELAAWLMRQGARRVWKGESGERTGAGAPPSQSLAEVFSKKAVNGEASRKSKKPKHGNKKVGGLDHDPGMAVSSR